MQKEGESIEGRSSSAKLERQFTLHNNVLAINLGVNLLGYLLSKCEVRFPRPKTRPRRFVFWFVFNR